MSAAKAILKQLKVFAQQTKLDKAWKIISYPMPWGCASEWYITNQRHKVFFYWIGFAYLSIYSVVKYKKYKKRKNEELGIVEKKYEEEDDEFF